MQEAITRISFNVVVEEYILEGDDTIYETDESRVVDLSGLPVFNRGANNQ